MLAYIGTVQKEINSTKQYRPSTAVDLQLKEGTSFITPVFKIQESTWKVTYNYIYVPKWSRYYFIDDAVIAPGGIWYLTCAIDVLATWKTNILASTAYVSRSASNYSLDIEDPTWTHSCNNHVSTNSVDIGLNSTGVYLITVAGAHGTAGTNPSQGMYVLTGAQLRSLCIYMFSSDFYDSFMEAGNVTDENLAGFGKALFNPFQYITSCMWLPLTVDDFTSSDAYIDFGWWTYEGEKYPYIFNGSYTKTWTYTPGDYGYWCNRSSAWTNVTVYVPGFQQITINPEFVGKELTFYLTIDYLTGEAGLFVMYQQGESTAIIQSATGKLGCSIQLSNLYEDLTQDLGSVGSAIVTGIKATAGAVHSAVTGGHLKGFLTQVGANMANSYGYEVDPQAYAQGNSTGLAEDLVKGAQSALQPTLSTIGANGTRSIIKAKLTFQCTVTYFTRYEDLHERLGGMCCKVLTLGDLSGYTEVVNPHIDLPATTAEINMINTYLSGGFYIE